MVQLFATPGSSVHGIFQARILEWVAISFTTQGIFPTQGSNPGLRHCGNTLYRLSHQGIHSFPENEWVGLSWEQGRVKQLG